MALYIGVNYHPHDWTPERWDIDIQLMKEAGFQIVRMGHLCWDSYEPNDGVYTFEWFDDVMDRMQRAGLKVILDISMHPAPQWVHKLCPGCNIHGKSGNMQSSVRRYMEDVDDPEYQFYAHRFARTLVTRYRNHPALMGFGLCNELGDGFISYSPYALNRFRAWLKDKYGTIENLNKTWNTQRWCRRLNSFDEVFMPENEVRVGAPEPYLDMRRFFSDGIGRFISSLQAIVRELAPDKPTSSNHCAETSHLGFDYQKYSPSFVDYPGIGCYPGFTGADGKDNIMTGMIRRLAELDKPMWCLEFQAGIEGIYAFPYGMDRMFMMLSLLHRTQMILGWTWRTMYGGEEQYYFGILDHDGETNRKYDEYKQVAGEFRILEKYGFPYLPVPEIGVAIRYDNEIVQQYARSQYRTPYPRALFKTQQTLSGMNYDYNFVDLTHLKHHYKLLILPNHVIMTEEMAETVRSFVKNGGTVIMTGYSAVVDDTDTVITSTHPGYLSDVFGIRVGGFRRVENPVTVQFADGSVSSGAQYYDEIQLRDATSFATCTDDGSCAVSVNRFGAGKAYYIAAETDGALLTALIERVRDEADLTPPLPVPAGVEGRMIRDGEAFYVNTTDQPQTVTLPFEQSHAVLRDQSCGNTITLPPYDAELFVK